MHILFVCSEFPIENRATGGFGSYVDKISQGLVSLGHKVTIVCIGENPKFVNDKKRNIWLIKPVLDDLLLYFLNSSSRFLNRLIKFIRYPLGFSLAVYLTIQKINKATPIDIIEGGDFGAEMFFYLLLRSAKNPKTVIKLHTPSFIIRKTNDEKLNNFYKVMEFLESFCLKKTDALNSPTKALAEFVCRYLHIKVTKIIPYPVIPIKMDARIKRDKNLVLYIGKFQKKKGVFVLVDAIPKIIKLFPKVKFILIGPDSMTNNKSTKEMLQENLKKGHCLNNVTFIENISQNELYKYYQKAIITVVPSIWENFPNVILEAMLLKSLVVSTKVGGILEIIQHKQTGIMVEPGDSKDLAKSIIKIIKRKKQINRMVQLAKKDIQNKYSLIKIAQKTISFYGKIMQVQ
ncbi:MAG: Glycosyl transferase group 1 [Candidatus Gottesmanbacteria bacterium GW2011_GWA1_34_13]|uniref:Glycosyl transferase group 1 n=1 Tax=Candidatus Gottesmanbacteria bacterium GW2011_GWA1_34_13 TaxID=1618434 RepID=A0A0G0B8G0_9BACT|nr:MAG: Glycosyl transferase group 1 [Candidatus Gottesmanbacteria bacterium GW2011_GWA1_34_13]